MEKLINEIDLITQIEDREEIINNKLTEEKSIIKKIVNFFKR